MTTDNTNDVKPPEVNLADELAKVKAEAEATKAELLKAKSTEQGLRGSLQEKDRQLKEQKSLRDELTAQSDKIKILAAMLAEEKEGLSDDVNPQRKADLLKKFDELEEKKKQQDISDRQRAEQDEYNRKANSIYAEAKELFKDDEDKIADVEAYLKSGNPDLAQRKVEKARKTVTEKPKETEAQMFDRLKKEAKDAFFKEHPELLKAETPLPSGNTRSFQDIEKDYSESKISKTEYMEARRKQGLSV